MSDNVKKQGGKSAKSTLYKELYEQLKEDILSGRITDGEKLPSKRAMANEKNISVITVVGAYDRLIADGLLQARQRSGYYVTYRGRKMTAGARAGAAAPGRWKYDFRSASAAAEGFPFATWARLTRRVLTEQDSRLLSVIDPKGVWELRCEIARQLSVYRNLACDPGQIVIGAGSEYLQGLIYQLLGSKSWAFENPGYTKAARMLARLGASLTFLDSDEEGVSGTELAASPGIEVLQVTPSHSFPLGKVMSPGRRRELLSWVEGAPGRTIVEDDFDSEFLYEGRTWPSLYSMDRSDRVIYMNTFTRTLAPSMRIGYMVLPPTLSARYDAEFSTYSSTVPAIEQYVLAQFIAEGSMSRHLVRMRKLYRQRRDTLIEALRRHFGDRIEISGREAGVHLLITLKDLDEREVIKKAAAASVRLAGISEYTAANVGAADCGAADRGSADRGMKNALVMNFAGMTQNDLAQGVRELARALDIQEDTNEKL